MRNAEQIDLNNYRKLFSSLYHMPTLVHLPNTSPELIV